MLGRNGEGSSGKRCVEVRGLHRLRKRSSRWKVVRRTCSGKVRGLCRVKPQATYDSFVGDIGETYLREEGYTRHGMRTVDFLVGWMEKMEGVEMNAAYRPV